MAERAPLLGRLVQRPGGNARLSQLSAVARLIRRRLLHLNLLLVFVPLGFLAALVGWSPLVTLSLNFLAIIPLSDLVSDASDRVGKHWGPLLGGLLNASVGNSVELSFGVLAILRGQSFLAQAAMLGSILSDILLVNGACLIAAAGWEGTRHLNPIIADTLSSLMIITTMTLALPTALLSTNMDSPSIAEKILSFSRSTSIVLLAIYLVYLYFQLKTHKSVFLEDEDEEDHNGEDDNEGPEGRDNEEYSQSPIASADNNSGPADYGASTNASSETHHRSELYIALTIILACGALIVNSTVWVMDTIDEGAEFAGVTQTFIATIIVPIVSNSPEATAVMMAARRSRIDFALSVIVSSILQIGLFVLPALVVVGWCVREPMTLYLNTPQTIILFLAILTINQLHQDGSYTYLHGIIFIFLYLVFMMAVLALPEADTSLLFAFRSSSPPGTRSR